MTTVLSQSDPRPKEKQEDLRHPMLLKTKCRRREAEVQPTNEPESIQTAVISGRPDRGFFAPRLSIRRRDTSGLPKCPVEWPTFADSRRKSPMFPSSAPTSSQRITSIRVRRGRAHGIHAKLTGNIPRVVQILHRGSSERERPMTTRDTTQRRALDGNDGTRQRRVRIHDFKTTWSEF